jgi:uncharacterized SAM-binding protein YcdF (DUF218 family)
VLRLLISPSFFLFSSLLVLAALLWFRKERLPAVLATVLCCVFYVFCAPLPAYVVARLLAVAPAAECRAPGNAQSYVILVGGATGSARSANELHRLERATFQRLVYGLQLASASPDSAVLISGGAEVGLTNEARIAEQFALRFGWPAARLGVEEMSTDTWTSAVEVAQRLPRSMRPVLVTSASHMRRAKLAYRKSGLDVIACPVPDPEALIVPDSLIPQGGALGRSSQLLKEILGLVTYSMRSSDRTSGL